MKIIRFDSVGGASGDMLLGALIGLGADIDELNRRIGKLLPGEFEIKAVPFESFGINGIQAGVEIHDHHHDDHDHDHHDHCHGRRFREIRDLITASDLPERTRTLALAAFGALAEAEAEIHGLNPENVHFHEVGAVDSIVDVAGSCLALELLGIDAVSVSTLPTGSGLVRCSHGIYPVPSPAAARLLAGLKSRPCDDEPFEMVTPTGAALLATWPKAEISAGATITAVAESFGRHVYKSRPNLLRALLYEDAAPAESGRDEVILLETNIDDSSPEVVGHLCGLLAGAGAVDVWTTPVMMKKQRSAVMLSVLVAPERKNAVLELMFTESSTFGIREYPVLRHCLERKFEEIETPYGRIRMKIGLFRGRVVSRSPEYEDCRRAAEAAGVPLKTVYQSCR